MLDHSFPYPEMTYHCAASSDLVVDQMACQKRMSPHERTVEMHVVLEN
jgi:hypothetical protein